MFNDKGMFYGTNGNADAVVVFGVENMWGNVWRALAGWINDYGTQKVKMTKGQEDGSSISSFNLNGNDYIALQNSTPSGTSGGYVNTSQYSDCVGAGCLLRVWNMRAT